MTEPTDIAIDTLVRVTESVSGGPRVGSTGRIYRVDLNDPALPYRLYHVQPRGREEHGWAKAVEVIGPPRSDEQRDDDLIAGIRSLAPRQDYTAAYRWALVALVDGTITSADEIMERTGLPSEDAEQVLAVCQHALDHNCPADKDAARKLMKGGS